MKAEFESNKVPFRPYTITVQHDYEHNFYRGIANASAEARLKDISGFTESSQERLKRALESLGIEG